MLNMALLGSIHHEELDAGVQIETGPLEGDASIEADDETDIPTVME
jgi:hypothetical protein